MHVGMHGPLARVGMLDGSLGEEPGAFGRIGQADQPADQSRLTTPRWPRDHKDARPGRLHQVDKAGQQSDTPLK